MAKYEITLEDGSIYEVETEEDKQQSSSTVSKPEKGSPLKNAVVATGIGAGLYGAKKAFYKPADIIKQKEREIDNIKRTYLNEPDISSRSVSGRIEEKGNIKRQEMKISLGKEQGNLSAYERDNKYFTKNLQREISKFDDEILSKSIYDLSNSLKTNVPKFLNKTYENYEIGLDAIEQKLNSSNKKLIVDSFLDNVVNKTKIDAMKVGVLPEKLTLLDSVMTNTQRNGQPVSIKQLKGTIASLGNEIPREAKFKLTENWGKFLEENAPEVKSDLVKLNKPYSEVAKMRNALYKTMDLDSGEFDKIKLNRMLSAYSKSKVETGLQNTINLIAKGNEVSTPMPEVAGPFSKLTSAKSTREAIKKAGESKVISAEKSMQSTSSKISDLKNKIEESKLETMKWADKANKLISEQEDVAIKHPIRSGSPGKVIKSGAAVAERSMIAGIAKKFIPRIGGYLMVSSAVNAFMDPLKFIGDQVGLDIPNKGTLERSVLDNEFEKKPLPDNFNINEINKIRAEYNLGPIL